MFLWAYEQYSTCEHGLCPKLCRLQPGMVVMPLIPTEAGRVEAKSAKGYI